MLLALLWPAHAQSVGAFLSPGPLAEPHADLEGVTQCTSCHSPILGVTTELCVECHDEVGTQIATRKGFHANKADECGTCHAEHRGRGADLVQLDEDRIDHAKETGFPLEGGHDGLDCNDCHKTEKWSEVEDTCASCHEDPHGEPRHGALGTCDSCHTAASWDVAEIATSVFDHRNPARTDYVLEGKHLAVPCTECHVDAVFVPTEFARCTSCHDNPHRQPLGNRCETCHTVSGWPTRSFDHALAGWPLEGLHAETPCAECHPGSKLKVIAHETCGDCHTDPHRAQFAPRTCDACHTTNIRAFLLPDFDHAATAFPLAGKHVEVGCDECHGEGPAANYLPVAHADCDSCHDDAHEGRFEPTACTGCHTETGWGVNDFDHDRTSFPLLGKHREVTCETCHPDGRYSGVAHASCLDCHADQPHGTAFAPDRCDDCHVETTFVDIVFDHAASTAFDLAPQHTDFACEACHETLDAYKGTNATCTGCHLDNEPAGHFLGECDSCHKVATWAPATLGDNDHAITGFALEGSHSRAECSECHGPDTVARGTTSPLCVDCHAADDAHRNLLGGVCGDCHTPIAWFRTRFHHGTTGWPLYGAHRLAACDDCHATSYAGTPDDCRLCHEAEAPRTIPAHQSAFFPMCDECHRPFTWDVTLSGGR